MSASECVAMQNGEKGGSGDVQGAGGECRKMPALEAPGFLCVGDGRRQNCDARCGEFWQVPLHVCDERGQNAGNTVAHVYMGGSGATRSTREYVEAAAACIVERFNRSERLQRELADAQERERVAIASWDEERQRALREADRVIKGNEERDALRAELAERDAILAGLKAATDRLEKIVDGEMEQLRQQLAAARASGERLRAACLAYIDFKGCHGEHKAYVALRDAAQKATP